MVSRKSALRHGLLAVLVGGLAACGGSDSTAPTPQMYHVGGTVSGLATGAQLTVSDNAAGALVIGQSGTFSFAAGLPSGSPYDVTVNANPAGQTCSVAGGTGIVQSANIANIVVTCADQTFALGGPVSGLSTSGLLLKNGSDTVAVSAGATSFAFSQSFPYASSFAVSVVTQPQGLACAVQGGSGVMPAHAVTSVAIHCTDQPFTLGGSVSGLGSASGLVLANGTDTVSVTAPATTFAFTDRVAFGTAYQVTVQSAPAGLECNVTNGSGTMPAAAVTNVAVVCANNIHSVGGSLAGLLASGLVLTNGADTLEVPPRTGHFTMPTLIPTGSTYSIAVQTQPQGLTCTVSDGSGTMGSADVSSVQIQCAAGVYTVGGSVSGLSAQGLVLANGTDSLAVLSGAATFTMSQAEAPNSTYDVTVQAHPVAVHCQVADGSGIMGNTDVMSVGVSCGAGQESVLTNFSPANSGGFAPYGSLLQAWSTVLYGVTAFGGASGKGTIFSIQPDGTFGVLYSFAGGTDGAIPYGGLIQGADGSLYGATTAGGVNGTGVVFRINTSGVETVLYAFGTGSDAQQPYGSLLQGSDGNFYGTSLAGGANGQGTVFRITPSGTETVLHSFGSGTDGIAPRGALIQGTDGNLYGVTSQGGENGHGILFRMTLQGVETVLYSFANGTDAANPQGSLIQASDGNFYGLSAHGGQYGAGALFKLTAGGTESVLVSFGASGDGANPYGDPLQASDGDLYVLTLNGGANSAGALVRVTLAGTESVLYSFGGSGDGASPYGSLIETSDGTLWGATSAGGSSGTGTLFSID
jgi:uncharacterized repeat protein (TIGR03803 family)